jgi:hypothetical protein
MLKVQNMRAHWELVEGAKVAASGSSVEMEHAARAFCLGLRWKAARNVATKFEKRPAYNIESGVGVHIQRWKVEKVFTYKYEYTPCITFQAFNYLFVVLQRH